MKKFTTTLLLSLTLSGAIQAANADEPRPSAPDGEVAGYGYVDLGLPSGNLWATCNINGDSPYYPGDYFAWGETQSREFFRWLDYEFLEEWHRDANGHDVYKVTDIGEVISGTEYDAARTLWGDAWRIPTQEDWEELNECCTMEYLHYSSIPHREGMLISGPNGNRIFLSWTYSPRYIGPAVLPPAEYWTATTDNTLIQDTYPTAQKIAFSKNSSKLNITTEDRQEGFAIRPVISRQDVVTSVAALTDSTVAMRYENGIVSVSGSGNTDGCLLNVADLSGRRMLTSNVRDGKCHLSDFSKGIYIISLHKGSHTLGTLKIAVK